MPLTQFLLSFNSRIVARGGPLAWLLMKMKGLSPQLSTRRTAGIEYDIRGAALQAGIFETNRYLVPGRT
jgi:hypothetical protein